MNFVFAGAVVIKSAIITQYEQTSINIIPHNYIQFTIIENCSAVIVYNILLCKV